MRKNGSEQSWKDYFRHENLESRVLWVEATYPKEILIAAQVERAESFFLLTWLLEIDVSSSL